MKDDLHAPSINSAMFRFYQELNDFLPQRQQQTNFNHQFIATPSIKDIIEAIGVPHSAIDLILVNGKPVHFDYQLQSYDQISIYPIFRSIDIAPLNLINRGYSH